jgi:hypothetical protein
MDKNIKYTFVAICVALGLLCINCIVVNARLNKLDAELEILKRPKLSMSRWNWNGWGGLDTINDMKLEAEPSDPHFAWTNVTDEEPKHKWLPSNLGDRPYITWTTCDSYGPPPDPTLMLQNNPNPPSVTEK